MQAKNSGWRRAAAINHTPHPSPTDDKSDLFEASRICGRVFSLPSSCRFVLDQLCAAYGGIAIEGRIIVWPSNAWIEQRTGISERTIRFALRRLIDLGVIIAKDSPNGKRYARRDANGNIIIAYGFDLTPLLHRLSEFKDRLAEIRALEDKRRKVFDELTIYRRNALELLHRLNSEFPDTDTREIEARAQELLSATPRRRSNIIPLDAVRKWKQLHDEAESMLIAASAGENCRHKYTNKNTPENPCNNGNENVKAEAVLEKCTDAVEILGQFRFYWEMIETADRYRGILGISSDAWQEAKSKIGEVDAARLLYLVVQIQARPRTGAQQIRNIGGYFRVMTRMIADKAIDLDMEINRR